MSLIHTKDLEWDMTHTHTQLIQRMAFSSEERKFLTMTAAVAAGDGQ